MCKVEDVGSIQVAFKSNDFVTSKQGCLFIIRGMKIFKVLSDMSRKVLFLN